jgi:putative nucleotidyltransferase with HDIG domain
VETATTTERATLGRTDQRQTRFKQLVLATVHELEQDGVLVVDDRHRVVSYNQRFATMWDLSAKELATSTDARFDAMSKQLRAPDQFLRKVNYVYAHQSETSRDELQLIDGRMIERYSVPMHSAGKYFGRVWYFRDSTNGRRAEEALHVSERQLQEALAAARMGAFEWNVDTNEVIWSGGSEALFGFLPGTFDGTYDAFERCVSPQDVPGLREKIGHCMATRTPFATEFRIAWPDGSEHWIAGQGEFTFDDSGKPVRLRGIGLDITDKKRSDERLRRSMENTVAALAATVEARDPYTAGHQRQVAELAVAIARELGFDESRVHSIFLASILHDIGKIKIPTELLTLPRTLTRVEMLLLQSHVDAGYDILKGIDFPWPIAEFVRQHHERLDGSGYPRGLKGDEICLEARIIAVADMVQAIATSRPYRFARGIAVALAELEAGRTELFDAAVVDACLTLFRKGFSFDGRQES